MYYFHQDGGLDPLFLDADEPSDSHVYDPAAPVPTVGDLNLFLKKDPYDQRELESRDDVLTNTIAPLETPIAVAGPISVSLWASSSAEDTDYMAKLCDVYPDGRSMLILDAAIRTRFRDGFRSESFMTPGQSYRFDIKLGHTALAFGKGHRVRVDISSSNSPRFHPNPNTATPFHTDSVGVIATNTIYHDETRRSALVLSILPLDH